MAGGPTYYLSTRETVSSYSASAESPGSASQWSHPEWLRYKQCPAVTGVLSWQEQDQCHGKCPGNHRKVFHSRLQVRSGCLAILASIFSSV
jgi:hypothetical protein